MLSSSHRRRRASFALAGLLALLSTACTGVRTSPEPLVTDRPDFTEAAATVAPGRTQLEMGQTHERDGEVTRVTAGEVLLRTGLTSTIELRTAANSYTTERTGAVRFAGVEDPSIGVKVSLLRDTENSPKWRPELSLIAATSLPAGASPYRAQHALPETKLISSWTLSERLGFASNLNWSRIEAGTGLANEFSGSASFALSVHDRVGVYAEGFSFIEQGTGAPRADYVNGGITFLISNDLQLDARGGTRLGSSFLDRFFGLGISRRF